MGRNARSAQKQCLNDELVGCKAPLAEVLSDYCRTVRILSDDEVRVCHFWAAGADVAQVGVVGQLQVRSQLAQVVELALKGGVERANLDVDGVADAEEQSGIGILEQ